MTAARGMVTALTELAEYLHAKGKGSANLYAKRAYQDAAARVDEVNIGPAFQSVLDEMDSATPEPFRIEDTCCGKCPGGTCYVDQVTGA